jgi:hypothetical protein
VVSEGRQEEKKEQLDRESPQEDEVRPDPGAVLGVGLQRWLLDGG